MDYDYSTSTQPESEYVFQQAVTLTAYLLYNEEESDSSIILGWRVPTNYLPLLLAMTFGIMMFLILLLSLVAWRYCWVPRSKNQQEGYTNSVNHNSPRQNLRIFRNGPWAYVSVEPKMNQPTPNWTTESVIQEKPLPNPPNLKQESPTYVRQVSPSNSITINLNENNNFC